MIRVNKTANSPASLLKPNCAAYDGDDVQKLLVKDHDEKCYLCEQKTGKSFQIEHLKPHSLYPQSKYTWGNLFLACPYCNGRKSDSFEILDPSQNNIEDIISHRLYGSSIVFDTYESNPLAIATKELLFKLFNGEGKLRKKKEEMLYEALYMELNVFLQFVIDYQHDQSVQNKQKLIDSLLITKEFLGFKYWVIKDDDALFKTFKDYMVWNKQS